MLQFLFGAAVGAAGMYFGSDIVADNCARAAYFSEQTLHNEEMIDQKAMQKIAQWAYEGSLNQHLKELLPQFSQSFPSPMPPQQQTQPNFSLG